MTAIDQYGEPVDADTCSRCQGRGWLLAPPATWAHWCLKWCQENGFDFDYRQRRIGREWLAGKPGALAFYADSLTEATLKAYQCS